MNFGYQENIALPLLFIDGITRSGKSMLSGIIPSLKKMEHIQFSTELEMIISGLSLGALTPDYARAFLRIYFNERSYNLQLSRNVNFRPDDQTGIDNYPEPKIYYDRLKQAEGDSVIEQCRKGINYIPMQTHDIMVNMDYLNQMDINYKMLSLWRHPIDNIYSWWTRGWGERFNNDPRGFTILINGREELFPWYAAGFESQLRELNPMEKCIWIASDLLKRAVNQYQQNPHKEKTHILTFEDFCQRPDVELSKICNFLSTEVSECTPRYVNEARFPRELNPSDRDKKRECFKKTVRPEFYERLMDYSVRYESDLYGLRELG